VKKLLAYFRVHLGEALVYRATGFIWMLNDIGPALVALLFWLAAFQDQVSIAGYTVATMSIYYFGVMAINALIVPYPEYTLVEEIRSGSFSTRLNFIATDSLAAPSLRESVKRTSYSPTGKVDASIFSTARSEVSVSGLA